MLPTSTGGVAQIYAHIQSERNLLWVTVVPMRALLSWFAVVAMLSAVACAASTEEDAEATAEAIQEDPSREPQIVRVAVRFTRNEVSDVGHAFSDSWVPFTDVKREALGGFSWGFSSPGEAEKIVRELAPDRLAAGYGTAIFRVEIPYGRNSGPAYGLARVKLEREFINTELASTLTRHYSALRVRSGSDQPCMSITLAGGLEGKLRAVPVPFSDENFTERDWNVGDVDGSGRPIAKVVVGSFNFGAFCHPENVEGSTHVSGGAAVPGAPVFAMIDKSTGQGGGNSAAVHVNLVENDQGKVSVGATFSTNAGILNERDRVRFDNAVTAFQRQFKADVDRGVDAKIRSLSSGPRL